MRLLRGPAAALLFFSALSVGCDEAGQSFITGGDTGGGAVDPTTVGVGGSLVGVADTVDTDMDGVPDVVEGTSDPNGNGVPAHRDPAETLYANPVPTTGGPLQDGGANTTGNNAGTNGSTGGNNGDAGCGQYSAESQFERAPVDVIWAIDNSGSMGDDFLNVAAGLQGFTSSVASSGANIKVVMVSGFVITLDQAVQNDTETYNLRFTDVQSTNAFRVLLNDYPGYASTLRPEAPTHIIVVTDDTSDMDHNEFRTQMEANLGHGFFFHAITAGQGFGLGLYGTAYQDLAAETGGQSQPINGDWNVIFDELESAIVQTAELPCDVGVPQDDGADLNNVQVLYGAEPGAEAPFPKADDASQCGDAQAWHYDDNDAPTQIILCPAACEAVKAGGSLDVVVACEPPPPLI